MNVNIVIPCAGSGSRFLRAGYNTPKPFIDIFGKPMIIHVIENLSLNNARFIFIVRNEHTQMIKKQIKKIHKLKNAIVQPIDHITEGAACTVLHVRKFINNNDPIIIANSDQIIDIRFHNFVNDCMDKNLDGSIMTFKDLQKNPKWSFVKLGSDGLVKNVREKVPISDLATVGIYMFSKGKDFVDAAIDMIIHNERVNNEFYVCPVYNYAIKSGKKIGIFDIPNHHMHCLGTPEDLKKYTNLMAK